MKRLLLVVVVCALARLPCFGNDTLGALENGFAKDLLKAVRMYHLVNRKVPENWSELMEVLSIRHVFDAENAFRRAGGDIGFANSILEKYVFVTNRVNINGVPSGEVVMMGSRSLNSEDGLAGRFLILKLATNEFGYRFAKESEILLAFQNAGETIPLVGSLPKLVEPAIVEPSDFGDYERRVLRELALRNQETNTLKVIGRNIRAFFHLGAGDSLGRDILWFAIFFGLAGSIVFWFRRRPNGKA